MIDLAPSKVVFVIDCKSAFKVLRLITFTSTANNIFDSIYVVGLHCVSG